MFTYIRWIITKDLPAVLEIERLSFREDQQWNEQDFRHCLRTCQCIGMVAVVGGEDPDCTAPVTGFMIYELHKTKLELLTLAVHPQYRRQGVGAAFIAKLADKLSAHHRTRIGADVGERNLEAQLFFQSQGFLATRCLHEADGEDGIRMVYRPQWYAWAAADRQNQQEAE
jgi:ribosomal-protein-alanine N-acetyltransferase